jgi:ABC-type sugar transport system ATPase subunit
MWDERPTSRRPPGWVGAAPWGGLREDPERVRPEAFVIGREDLHVIEVVVDVVEPLGDEIIVHGSAEGSAARSWAEEDDLPAIALGSRAPITARFDPTARFHPGERLRLGVDPGRVHVFDARTGLALTSPAAG